MTNKKPIKSNVAAVLKLALLLLIFSYFIKTILFGSEPATVQERQVLETESPGVCLRTEPHVKQPEFERALSLILQRLQQKNSPLYSSLKEINNCIYVQYADLSSSGAEGLFYFDSEVSSANKLIIEVDSSYAVTDDLTTAFLLVHELAHARQFSEELKGKSWDCVDSEVDAYYSQLLFGSAINQEEGESVISRLEAGSSNSQLNTYEKLLDLSWNAIQACDALKKGKSDQEHLDCYKTRLGGEIRAWIVSSPFYQKQCGLK